MVWFMDKQIQCSFVHFFITIAGQGLFSVTALHSSWRVPSNFVSMHSGTIDCSHLSCSANDSNKCIPLQPWSPVGMVLIKLRCGRKIEGWFAAWHMIYAWDQGLHSCVFNVTSEQKHRTKVSRPMYSHVAFRVQGFNNLHIKRKVWQNS